MHVDINGLHVNLITLHVDIYNWKICYHTFVFLKYQYVVTCITLYQICRLNNWNLILSVVLICNRTNGFIYQHVFAFMWYKGVGQGMKKDGLHFYFLKRSLFCHVENILCLALVQPISIILTWKYPIYIGQWLNCAYMLLLFSVRAVP